MEDVYVLMNGQQIIFMKYDKHIIDSNGNEYWFNERGHYHRDNGLPAIEFANGTKSWYLDGVCYRWDEWIYKL